MNRKIWTPLIYALLRTLGVSFSIKTSLKYSLLDSYSLLGTA